MVLIFLNLTNHRSRLCPLLERVGQIRVYYKLGHMLVTEGDTSTQHKTQSNEVALCMRQSMNK